VQPHRAHAARLGRCSAVRRFHARNCRERGFTPGMPLTATSTPSASDDVCPTRTAAPHCANGGTMRPSASVTLAITFSSHYLDVGCASFLTTHASHPIVRSWASPLRLAVFAPALTAARGQGHRGREEWPVPQRGSGRPSSRYQAVAPADELTVPGNVLPCWKVTPGRSGRPES
jgi:hypothetical protein